MKTRSHLIWASRPGSRLILAAAVALTTLALGKAEPSGDSSTQQDEGESPTGAIMYALKPGKEDSKQLWLSESSNPTKKALLCSTPGWGSLVVTFAPDDSWIVVEDGGSSLGISLRLFRRQAGLKYQEATDVNIDDKVELAALRANKLPEQQVLEHRYLHVLQASADGTAILVSLKGRGKAGGRWVTFNGWVAVYNLKTHTVNTELSQINDQSAILK